MADRPADAVLAAIADYVCDDAAFSESAYQTAHLALVDSLGCAFLALGHPACTRLLGPVVPGTSVPGGVRVPGTSYALDPVQAAFDIGTLVRWLDFNDTWLAAEWGHPSDNLGAILAAASYAATHHRAPLTVRDVWTAMIRAHEIQGVLALDNAFNRHGLDHVLLVRVASAAVATRLLGGSRDDVLAATSQAWLDGGTLRIYRQAPNVGSRKSWAAGDATSRGLRLALLTLRGESGYPTVLSTPEWGFQDVAVKGLDITLARPLGSYVMENVLFKISYPAEFHAQTAAEAAAELHPLVAPRLDEVDRIELKTHESALRIISKTGPLRNPADRDHCLQYIVAVSLLRGDVTAEDYEDAAAADPRIDRLRERMTVTEHEGYSADYLDPAKRSIANAVRVHFSDGTSTERVAVEYPLGHRRRRDEGTPRLVEKFERNVRIRFGADRSAQIFDLCCDRDRLTSMPVPDLLSALAGPLPG